MTDRAARIHHALTLALAPATLDVVDDSAKHAGHSGARAGGQTHYSVTLVTPAFRGLNRVQRHRLVNDALAGEFEGGLHALSLILRTPEEAAT